VTLSQTKRCIVKVNVGLDNRKSLL